jgi:hypothetical protein
MHLRHWDHELLRAIVHIVLFPLVLFVTPQQPQQAVPDPPVLTEIESTKMQAVNEEVQKVNALYQVAQLAKDKADQAAATAQEHMAGLKKALEASRPGWTIDMQSGKWSKTPEKKDK